MVESPAPPCRNFLQKYSIFLLTPSLSLCAKFQTSSTFPSVKIQVRVVLVVLLVLVVTGGKQSQLLVLSLSLKFDKSLEIQGSYLDCQMTRNIVRNVQILNNTSQHSPILSKITNIVQYSPILSNIDQYFHILPKIVLYCSILLK